MKNETLKLIENIEKVKGLLTSMGKINDVAEISEHHSENEDCLNWEFLSDEEETDADYCDCFNCDCEGNKTSESDSEFSEFGTDETEPLVYDASSLLKMSLAELAVEIEQDLNQKEKDSQEMLEILDDYSDALEGFRKVLIDISECLLECANQTQTT